MARLTRRQFLSTTAAATAAATIVPRRVLGGTGYVAPSDKINIAHCGCGSQGLRMLMPALRKPELNFVAVCDPNRKADDYPTWGQGELKGSIRRFLEDETWGDSTPRDGLCGREIGQEIVNRHYAKQTDSGQYNDCRGYADFREMLEKETDLDAVYVMTPEHLHATISLHAMRMGKHALCHKSMATVLHEAQVVRDTTHRTGLATMMHCSSDSQATPMLTEWIRSGVIGQVREVHNWTDRPYWPQGMYERPKDRPPIPSGFNWDLWLGPVPDIAYHPAYTHATFRGWYDFGSGCLGDVANYSYHQIFSVMNLGAPLNVQSFPSRFYSIKGGDWGSTWHREVNELSFPESSMVQWDFPARGDMAPMTLFWYDGGMVPRTPEILLKEGVELNINGGLMFVGDDGIILAGRRPQIYPSTLAESFEAPPETLPRPAREIDQFIAACQGGAPTLANYEQVYAQTEAIIIGNIGYRFGGKKLQWDKENAVFTNEPEANKLLTREYRPGWEI